MSNQNDMPNAVHHSGDVTFGARFAGLVSCRPVNLAGIGHQPHVEARFLHGVRLELDRQTASDLAQALTRSVASLPLIPDLHDAAWSGEA